MNPTTRFTEFLIENLHAGLVVVDMQRRVTLINRMARDILENAGGVVVQPGDVLPQWVPAAEGPVSVALREGREVEGYIWEPRPDLILEVSSAPLRDESGQLVGAMALARDVTQVQAMEAKVRRMEQLAAVGQLAAGAAHEIRNPLTAIRGFIQLLAQGFAPGDPRTEYTRIILEEVDRVDAIVQGLLVLGRPVEPVRSPVSLAGVLDEVLLLVAPDLAKSGIRVERQYPDDLVVALADRHMIRQVAHNLIRNAIEAMPGGGQLAVTIGGAGTEVWFQVADTGPGLSDEQRAHLFLPFFTTKETGTGLGLAISHALTAAHGGRIEVGAKAGRGTLFQVVLPAAPVARQEAR